MTTLIARGLVKVMGGRRVLDRIDLRVEPHAIVAVTGPNGAGKSTLLRVLAGVLEPDAGDVSILGRSLARDRAAALRDVGYAPESADFPPHLGVGELLDLVAALRGGAPLDAGALDRLGVSSLLRTRLGALSLGQRRRATLAAALTGAPRLLLLDEPTNGLDAESLEALVVAIDAHVGAGGAAIVATHDRAFVERVATTQVTLVGGAIARP